MARRLGIGGRTIERDVRDLKPYLSYQSDTMKVKVSNDDTAPGFLADKLAAVLPLQLSVLNDAADEDVQISFADQSANTFLGGPASGADAAPAFRALEDDDIPAEIARLTDLHDEVTLAVDAAVLLNLADQEIGFVSQSANTFLAGATSGGAADPTFRAIVFADVPTDDDPTGQAILASDANGRLGLEGIGIGTTANGDYIRLASGGIIGLSNSGAGRLEFTNASTDLIEVHDADLHLVDGGVTKLELRHHGDVGGTASDIWAADSMGLAAEDNLFFFIDSADNDTISYFAWHKDGETDGAATEMMRLDNDGALLIGTNGKGTHATTAVIVNQAGTDDDIMQWRDETDVNHGMTDITQGTAYFRGKEVSAAAGGAMLHGFSEATIAMQVRGSGTTADTTDTSSSDAFITLEAFIKSGTSHTAPSASHNIVAMIAGGQTRLLLKGDGDLHLTNTSLTALDHYDDVALLRTLDRETTIAGFIQSQWDEFVTYNRQHLQDAGVLVGDFISAQALQRLHNGAIWQLHERISQLEAEIADR